MRRVKAGLTILILFILSAPQALMARSFQDHVLEVEELRDNLVADSSQRQAHIEAVRKVLRHDLVQEHVGKLVDLEKIDSGITSLDDATLAQLAAQSREVDEQLGAGVSSWVLIIIFSAALLAVLLLI